MIEYHDSLKYLLTNLHQAWINEIILREVFADQQVALRMLI